MSVQLILYPQGHNGVYNQYSNPSSNFIVNGDNFTGLDNTPTVTNFSITTAIFLNPAVVPNSWYRYSYPITPQQYASESNGNCIIPDFSASGFIGIYQRMTDLTAGISYILKIDIVPPATPNNGTIRVVRRNTIGGGGPFVTTNHSIDETTTQLNIQLGTNAQWQLYDETVFVGYKRSNSSSTSGCVIGRIQVIPEFGSSGSILLDDGQVICDLYEDEDLPLTLSVDEFKNVAEKPQSYSKAFNLPATKRNNKIFDHIFEITRHLEGGSPLFNPYQKTQCVLKQDGLLIFQGYLRMLDIVDKGGEISYNVNLYSEVVALADLLKDKKFSDLSFTELEHDYDRVNIQRSNNNGVTSGQTIPITYLNPNTSGFRTNFNTIKYPFIDWTGQLTIANGSTNATSGFPELASLEQAFRPCINIKYLIDRIFADVPFTYISTFFNTTEFSELFMDFNWGEGNSPANIIGSTYAGQAPYAATIYLLPYATPTFANLQLGNYQSNFNITPPNYDQSTNILTATETNETYEISYEYTCNPGSNNIYFQWLHTDAAGVPYPPIDAVTNPITSSGFITYVGSFTVVMQIGDTLEAQFRADGVYAYQYSSFLSTVYFIKSISAVTSQVFLQTLRGELGQWEFLKGILTMFNLVTIPDKDNPDNIIIEPYVDTFINNTNKELNWTDKIDISEMKLEPLTDLNKNTLFKYVEDEDDYAFQNYKESTSGFLYGSMEYDATNEFNILEGTEEIEASPFAATVIKSLEPVSVVNFVTPAMYSMNDDGTSEAFDNSPRIFYNRGLFGGVSYYIPAQNNQTEQQAVEYGYFSHLRFSLQNADARDLNFGIQQLFPNVFGGTVNNLYNLYWADYFNELYNINTRVMTIKVNLNSSDLNTFQFNQRVFIKNRLFRVNKIDYKPNDLSTVEFILVQHSSGRGGGGD